MSNNDYKKLTFICNVYEKLLRQLIGEDAFIHLSKNITMELIRRDIAFMPEGEFKEFNKWLLGNMESQTDEEWNKEWGGTNCH